MLLPTLQARQQQRTKCHQLIDYQRRGGKNVVFLLHNSRIGSGRVGSDGRRQIMRAREGGRRRNFDSGQLARTRQRQRQRQQPKQQQQRRRLQSTRQSILNSWEDSLLKIQIFIIRAHHRLDRSPLKPERAQLHYLAVWFDCALLWPPPPPVQSAARTAGARCSIICSLTFR